MLRLLGSSEYGLYQLVASVVSYLSLISLGFGSSYVRYYSKYKINDDAEGISILNGMFMSIFLIMSGVCLLCGMVLTYNIELVFGNGLTTEEYRTASILMIIMIINMAITFPNSVYSCIITANEKFVFQKGLLILQNVASPFITLPLLIMGYGSVGMAFVTSVLTITTTIINAYYVKNKLKQKFKFNNFNYALFRDIRRFTFFIFLNQIIDQINWSIDKFLLGRYSGTTAVALYGVGATLNAMYVQLSSSISNVFAPEVNKLVAGGANDNILSNLFTKVGRVQFYILFLILSGFGLFGDSFIDIWAGRGYHESYLVAMFLLIPVTVPLIQNIGIEIQRAKNKHQVRSVVYFFIAIINIIISIPLILKLGAVGAAIGTAITMIAGNGIFMNIYYHKRIGINIVNFWREIARLVPGLIIPLVVGFLLKKLIIVNNILKLLLACSIYAISYFISVYNFSFNDFEKQLIGRLKK